VEAAEYSNIFQNETSHFYYRAMHSLILRLIRKYQPARKLTILDAGCGTGLLATKLSSLGTVEAIDFSPLAVSFCKERGINAVLASVTQLPFADDTFDTVVSSDVLYHLAVQSDMQALAEMARVLKPGGSLVMRVPAVSWLRSSHDRHVHTRERYDRKSLCEKITASGLVIEKISYVGLVLFPFAWVRHCLQKRVSDSSSSAVKPIAPAMNRLFYVLLSLENWIVRYLALPYGIGLVAVGRKPK
jgi:SAM-dependent methyltransferase